MYYKMMHQFYWRETNRSGYIHKTEGLSQKKCNDIKEIREHTTGTQHSHLTGNLQFIKYHQKKMHIESYDFEGGTWSMHSSREE